LAYVDLNAVRARLTERAGKSEWSSAKAPVAGVASDALLDGWAGSELRRASGAELPFGDDGFVAEMEARAGRELRRRRPGPQPRREAESGAGGCGAVPDRQRKPRTIHRWTLRRSYRILMER
jgi:hypothetical protein